MAKILVIIQDEKLSREIVDEISAAGFVASAAPSGELPALVDADAVIIDLGAAGRWAAALRAGSETANLPIIGLAADSEIADDTLILLDDIVFTPVVGSRLVMRIKRILLRTGKLRDKNRIRVGELVINLESYEVSIGNQIVELTYKEYELLRFLAGHPGRVYDRQTLLNQIWEYDYFGGTRTVDVHIRRLRAKLGSKSSAMIQTVRHVGYRFSTEKEV